MGSNIPFYLHFERKNFIYPKTYGDIALEALSITSADGQPKLILGSGRVCVQKKTLIYF